MSKREEVQRRAFEVALLEQWYRLPAPTPAVVRQKTLTAMELAILRFRAAHQQHPRPNVPPPAWWPDEWKEQL